MRIGVGLPTTTSGASPDLLVPWARRAAEGPFGSLAAHDRLAYDSLEPLAALAAAAAVTERIRLASLVVIGPLRSPALLAKQAATLNALAGGRLALGVGSGPRRDDYEVAGVPFAARNRLLETQLRRLREHWEDQRLGPSRPPELLVGGLSDGALVRMARYADGFVHSGGPPRAFAAAVDRAKAAWSDLGRPGRPRIWGLGYYALGPEAEERGQADLRHYYGFLGAFSDRIAGALITSSGSLREFATAYSEAGCDELVLFPTVAELDQVDRLAEAVAGL